MSEERLIILVPTEDDRTRADYKVRYWPNFVVAVKEALNHAKISARVVVARPEDDRETP